MIRSARFLALLLFPIAAYSSDFPPPPDTQPLTSPFLTPEESLAKMKLPPGFKGKVFAAEPHVNNPIAYTWDQRGRLWIAENFTYGDRNERYNLKLRDRIIILEDTNHDGVHDKRTVFADDLQMLTSIERGLGGIWAVAPPHLLFIPDANGDDIPDGPPQVMLDGFSTQAASRHTFANGLKWGPDGWLYGRIGISSTSYIGVPGSPEKDRLGTAGGLWRYHPTRKTFDIVCAGTTNPWGHDWDAQGNLFFINTVIGHLWQGIHGAHLKRMHGQDLNRNAYQLMDQIADHYHWDTGKSWTASRDGAATADALGGGHAHVGMMIYQGTNWPKEYRDKLMTLNFGGRRMNVERLEPHGSGYIGRHEPDMLKTDDIWFRGIDVTYGPDGGVYILDWSDIGECHDDDGVHRNSGRIFKITHGDPVKPAEADLTKLSTRELVNLQGHENEWLVRMARWELRERLHRGEDASEVWTHALANLNGTASGKLKIDTLSLLSMAYFPGNAPSEQLLAQAKKWILSELKSGAEPVQAMAARIMFVQPAQQRAAANNAAPHLGQLTDDDLALIVELAGKGSPRMRLVWSEVLGCLPAAQRPHLAAVLLSHAADASDPYLPLMYWYGIMDLAPAELVKLFPGNKIPLVSEFMVRRCAEDLEKEPKMLDDLLALAKPDTASHVLQGLTDALKGWAKAPKPGGWEKFVSLVPQDTAVQNQLRALNVLFGDGRALDDIKRIALDDSADIPTRASALKSLINAKADGLQEICEKLVRKQGLSMTALRGLTLFDDPSIGQKLGQSYSAFYPAEKAAVLEVLTSRKAFAKALLDNISPSRIPKEHLTAVHARQIQAFNDPELNERLEKIWGSLRETTADKKQLMDSLQAELTPEVLAKGNKSQGRVVFNTACASCHKLYGEGHLIGPDLTGSGRTDVAYLISNIVDPSGILANDYKMTVVTMKDGRILSGNVSARTDRTLTLKMIGQEQTVETSEIAKSEQLPMSLMPEGLLMALSKEQIRDLFAYLMTDGQVPLPEQKEQK